MARTDDAPVVLGFDARKAGNQLGSEPFSVRNRMRLFQSSEFVGVSLRGHERSPE